MFRMRTTVPSAHGSRKIEMDAQRSSTSVPAEQISHICARQEINSNSKSIRCGRSWSLVDDTSNHRRSNSFLFLCSLIFRHRFQRG